ncbi:methylphosphotriester-DNA--protein-cysteine methyltransferase family protein [Paenibacillus antri]|uniref:Methylphosphotriester-DNA--protein-cysteine methyltransferase family protein n=1 Tax=Paenibacillus antri TaxID=2582848 RepID=A0A5R9G9K2_9BACL|nr:Ada metal-binding domain-containing protein [Paenibacillus antri]TLS49754.1 methylphosphotriester-DNA--protein-cysteine methyltransferase family protein [Paenibacillus antri]
MERELFERIYATVARRESTYDGVYYTGVRTTKIVCRPSCRAKTPKPENVTFYPSLEAALAAGFRPCKRCKPDENGVLSPDAAMAAQADAILAGRYADKVTLSALADELAVSPYHLQRTYKRVRGVSPAETVERLRREEAERRLARSDDSVADIAASIGFGTASHFTVWFARGAGMTPTAYRNERRTRSE